jgi:hypothetical protein
MYFCEILGTLQITQFIHNFLNSYSFFYSWLTSPSPRPQTPLEALKKNYLVYLEGPLHTLIVHSHLMLIKSMLNEKSRWHAMLNR